MEEDTLGGGVVELSTLAEMKAKGYFTPEKARRIREYLAEKVAREATGQKSTRPEPAARDGAG